MTETQASNDEGLDLWIIGGIGEAAMEFGAALAAIAGMDYIRINDAHNMVQLILQRLQPDKRIRRLWIVDHGRAEKFGEGTQRFGATVVKAYDGARDGIGPTDLAKVFFPLRGRFVPGGKVIIEGCNAGKADMLLRGISYALGGVPVGAGSSRQRAITPGLDGYVRMCVFVPHETPTCSTTSEATVATAVNDWFDESLIGSLRSAGSRVGAFVVHLWNGFGR